MGVTRLLSTPCNRRRWPPLTVLVAIGASLLIMACSSADPEPWQSPGGTPQLYEDVEPTGTRQAVTRFDGSNVSLVAQDSPWHRTLEIVNASAESAISAGPLEQSDRLNGFEYSGNCRYDNERVAASNGQWTFQLANACNMVQLSNARVTPGDGLTLLLDVLLNNEPGENETQLLAHIVAEQDDGSLSTLALRQMSLANTGDGWQAVQITVPFGQADMFSNRRIGVQLINPMAANTVFADRLKLSSHSPNDSRAPVFAQSWRDQCDQLWAGENFWSNRLQDWEVSQGRLRTRDASEFRPNRTTHRITTVVSAAPSDFSLRVTTGVVDTAESDAYSGFLIGAGGRMDYRSASLVHNRHGKSGGLIAAVDGNGRAFLLDHDVGKGRLASGRTSGSVGTDGITLQLDATLQSNGKYLLNVFAIKSNGQPVSSAQAEVEAVQLLGNIALVSNPGSGNTTHWFDNWSGYGAKLHEMPGRQLGPVLFSSYTLSRGELTLNAQYPPVCHDVMPEPELQIRTGDSWQTVASTQIDSNAFTARFSVPSWNHSATIEYRIVTRLPHNGEMVAYYFHGAIQPDTQDENEFVLGVYNCRPGLIASDEEGWIQQNNVRPFTWTRERIVFPHEELLQNSQQHPLTLVAFLGDQIYEFDPNGLIEERPEFIVNDYLWKWFQFGWSARELMRNLPTVILPDDHDVYQANLWGQAGRPAAAPEVGGYVYPAAFIDVVEKTQTGSLPAPHSNRPLNQAIDTYYTSLVYRGVGIAVLEDRKFKTGPESTQQPRQLLGSDQLAFLEQWAADWRGQSMKLAVSQSPFSQSTTHAGQHFTRINRDQDSNGWPKQGRDDAVTLLRKAYAPHIAGDQHLGMSLKHGIEAPDDAVYSFAGPSMLNIFPRVWDPANQADGPGDRQSSRLGRHTDAHGNFINVLAVANPDVYYKPVAAQPVPSKNELGIGYGIVRINKALRQYTFEAWPANVAPDAVNATPYSGWPFTVDQMANDGRIPVGYLVPRQAPVAEPVIQVFNEKDASLVYARRSSTPAVVLPVFDSTTTYRVVLSDPSTGYREQFEQQTVQ